ncbi:AAA family ATPase [Brucella intermedia]|uniref:AAA family ATPase n=1 Tax=Brucella intermedia TaxID=94625 RepID=UPI0027345F49|nr:AAA family ATPase [Brucella intermedia]WLF96469.1 AAA family ATPase [Brucella intermedia]
MEDISKDVINNSAFEGVRLVEFEIFGLFGRYDYKIPLNVTEHITAIIAPNGTGKTLCLRLIAALFNQKWASFIEVDFLRVVYTFNNGMTIEARKKPVSGGDEEQVPRAVTLTVKPLKGKPISWTPKLAEDLRAFPVERYLPFMNRVGPNKWRDGHTGELMPLDAVLEVYQDMLPEHITESVFGAKPRELISIVSQIDCKLIETQRLLILSDEDYDRYSVSRNKRVTNLAITRKAEKLKEIIAREISAYATLSQSLDRSFPRRVITQAGSSPEGLVEKLESLDKKRLELMEAGILDKEADSPVEMPEGPLNPAIASVLNVYAEDTGEKLSSLSPLLAKIKLFKKLIDQRFVTKDVNISKKNGIDVISQGFPLSLDKLSSGEQHQLVLFFELLFEIKKNSLILIDEPELSLHVAWQKKFIGDLLSIINLNKFDVILATHSPQLISRWSGLVVELGDVYEGDYDEQYNEEGDEH